MNQFSDKFYNRMRSFWDGSAETEKQQLLDDILKYANTNSYSFKNDIAEIWFDNDLQPLPIVLEALAKDTENWGKFYVDLLDNIFEKAKQVEKPKEILTYLMEFAHIEKDDKPFIQEIADRLYKELNTDNIETKLAAIWTLPSYLNNKAIKNKNTMVYTLQQLLTDNNWKVRVVAFKALGFENLLPLGHKLSFKDKIFKLILGEPQMI